MTNNWSLLMWWAAHIPKPKKSSGGSWSGKRNLTESWLQSESLSRDQSIKFYNSRKFREWIITLSTPSVILTWAVIKLRISIYPKPLHKKKPNKTNESHIRVIFRKLRMIFPCGLLFFLFRLVLFIPISYHKIFVFVWLLFFFSFQWNEYETKI